MGINDLTLAKELTKRVEEASAGIETDCPEDEPGGGLDAAVSLTDDMDIPQLDLASRKPMQPLVAKRLMV